MGADSLLPLLDVGGTAASETSPRRLHLCLSDINFSFLSQVWGTSLAGYLNRKPPSAPSNLHLQPPEMTTSYHVCCVLSSFTSCSAENSNSSV